MSLFYGLFGLLAISACAAALFLWRYCWQGPSLAKSVIKTTSVAGLALAALIGLGPMWLIVALSLAAIGDLALSRDGRAAFLIGLIAFAGSHLAYIALLTGTGAPLSPNLLTVVVCVFAAAMVLVLFPRAGGLRWAVVLYVAIIGAMGAIAMSLPMSFVIAMCAAASFMVSDMFLGLERFVLGPTYRLRAVIPYAIWSTYWGAQFLFVLEFVVI